MSRYYYSIGSDQTFAVRGSAKLLTVASYRYGSDWHSVPHTHNHTELFFIVGGKGQFLIQNQAFPMEYRHNAREL